MRTLNPTFGLEAARELPRSFQKISRTARLIWPLAALLLGWPLASHWRPLSSFSTTIRLDAPASSSPYYDFSQSRSVFSHRLNYKKTKALSREHLLTLLKLAIPARLHEGFEQYAPFGLELAQKYGVDPLWVLAIMWTESHFSHTARSPVGAIGVMQIMPATGTWLAGRMFREGLSGHMVGPHPQDKDMRFGGILNPRINIESGVYYLNRLLKRFRGSGKLATVAYNMGPGWVYWRLRSRRPVGVKNLYLEKVQKAYFALARVYQTGVRDLPVISHQNYIALHRGSAPSSHPELHRLRLISRSFYRTQMPLENYVMRHPALRLKLAPHHFLSYHKAP